MRMLRRSALLGTDPLVMAMALAVIDYQAMGMDPRGTETTDAPGITATATAPRATEMAPLVMETDPLATVLDSTKSLPSEANMGAQVDFRSNFIDARFTTEEASGFAHKCLGSNLDICLTFLHPHTSPQLPVKATAPTTGGTNPTAITTTGRQGRRSTIAVILMPESIIITVSSTTRGAHLKQFSPMGAVTQ